MIGRYMPLGPPVELRARESVW